MTDEQIMQMLKDKRLIRPIARELDLSTAAIYAWKRVPAEKLLRVEEITGIPREELRPDLYEGMV